MEDKGAMWHDDEAKSLLEIFGRHTLSLSESL